MSVSRWISCGIVKQEDNMDPIYFMVNGIEYVIQNVAGRRYKEIVFRDTGIRVENQKQFCRDYGIAVPTDENVMNTHKAIDLLIERLARGH
jgi:hypothetical protein